MEKAQSSQPADDTCHCLVPTTLALEGSGRGPLRGSTFVAKDLFAIEGHTSSFGHPAWRATHSPSPTTAPAVDRLLDAGADLVGMTKLDQLAYSLIGDVGEGEPPVNSIDPSLFCGGSSSGSAAAVAAGLADFGLGTDTAGSVRVPAAVCGLVGIRPTHASIPSDGVLPLAPSFDVVGLFARRVPLLADALKVTAPELDLSSGVTSGEISVQIAGDVFEAVDAETERVGREVAELAAAVAGAAVEEISFGSFTDADAGNLFARIQSREIWAEHAEWVEANGETLASDVRTRLERCARLSQDPDEVKAADLAGRAEYRERLMEAVPRGTVVVLPVLPRHGPKRSWAAPELAEFRTDSFRLMAPASLSGAPQTVWSVRTTTGRSIGIGLLTAPGDDHTLLELMGQLGHDHTAVT